MRLGDWVVAISFSLNVLSALAYGYQSQWPMVMYFVGAGLINLSLILAWIYR